MTPDAHPTSPTAPGVLGGRLLELLDDDAVVREVVGLICDALEDLEVPLDIVIWFGTKRELSRATALGMIDWLKAETTDIPL